MEKIAQYIVSGFSQGGLYSLVAIGIVLIYRSNRVLNFAHGDVTTASAFIASYAVTIAGIYVGITVSLIIAALISIFFYFAILLPAGRRMASNLNQTILTLGFGLIIQGLIIKFGTTEPRAFLFPLSDTIIYNIGPIFISQLGCGALIVGILGSTGLYLLIQKTRLGLAMRAVSENLSAAQTLGIPTRKILAFSWGLAAFSGSLAGLFLAAALLLDPFYMLEPFLKGFAAAILGGLNSLPGAIVGGLILGVVEALAGGFISVAFKNTAAFLIIIIVLLFRPEGLLGNEFIERI